MKYLVVLALFLWACQPEKSKESVFEATQHQEISLPKNDIQHAQTFRIEYIENYKILHFFKSSPTSTDTIKFVLVQKNTPIPEGFTKEQIIEIPIQKIATTSTTQIAQLDTLNLLDKIVGVTDLNFISDPKILKKIAQKSISQIGTEGQLNQESLINSGAELVLMSSFSEQDKQQIAKFNQLGIKALPITDWLENTPLGRTEWLKLLAALFNEETKAQEVCNGINTNYLKIKDLAQKTTSRPKVFRGMPYKNTWYVAGGKSYVAQLLADAGADYAWKTDTNTGSLPLDFEAVYPIALKADFWLLIGDVKNKQELLANDARFEKFLPFQRNMIFSDNKKINTKGDSDYYTKGVNNPHLILADLVKIFHPEALPEHSFVYFKKIE